ncbi:hypothetical protein WN48_09785 [Eufriesea mexicana]|uniref:Uncharacterized protein n=1 Tax=Eufriesea mexicana TaxID=516756 RepID=A0A310S725_9HYME|nr:hypothetical protein WN48_09785 [Eufriesea mexicana]
MGLVVDKNASIKRQGISRSGRILEGSISFHDKRSAFTGAARRPLPPPSTPSWFHVGFTAFPNDVYDSIRDQEVNRTHGAATSSLCRGNETWLGRLIGKISVKRKSNEERKKKLGNKIQTGTHSRNVSRPRETQKENQKAKLCHTLRDIVTSNSIDLRHSINDTPETKYPMSINVEEIKHNGDPVATVGNFHRYPLSSGGRKPFVGFLGRHRQGSRTTVTDGDVQSPSSGVWSGVQPKRLPTPEDEATERAHAL